MDFTSNSSKAGLGIWLDLRIGGTLVRQQKPKTDYPDIAIVAFKMYHVTVTSQIEVKLLVMGLAPFLQTPPIGCHVESGMESEQATESRVRVQKW